MNIDFTLERGVLLATLHDRRLDASGEADFKTRVGNRFEAGNRFLVLDLSAVEFVDSTGLAAILSILKRLPPNGALALAGCRKQVVDLVKLTRLDRILRLFATSEDALQALAGEQAPS